MNGTHAVTHDYLRKATVNELRLMLLLIDQNQHLDLNWAVLVRWAQGYEPALPAARVISLMQEIAERGR